VTVVAGATNVFAVVVASLYATSYQWQFDGTNLNDGGEITGSATISLTLTGVTIADTGTYTITATSVAGTASASGALTVVPALIQTQPASAIIPAGATNIFTVAEQSFYAASYQWQFNGTNLADGGKFSGTSTSSLTLSGAALAESGKYSVIVSNAAGAIQSQGAMLTVEPFITLATPANLTVMSGAAANFNVSVKYIGAISYQWQFNGTNLTDGSYTLGSGASSLTINPSALINSGTYSVLVSNAYGTGSWTAMLTVIPQTAVGCTVSNLHSFTSVGDGGHPNGLLLGHDGALYGTTSVARMEYYTSNPHRY
jgi:Immunoglobulin I-set domain